MAFLQTQRRSSASGGGGGGGEILRWVRASGPITTAITAGVTYFQLSPLPVDSDGIIFIWEGDPLSPSDWSYDAGTGRLYFNFDWDPTADSESGIGYYYYLYQYQI